MLGELEVIRLIEENDYPARVIETGVVWIELEITDPKTQAVRRERLWESCFNAEHSYMNSGLVRKTIRARYRQWLTHKLATWIDQFGASGCVGCGRCITWCPVGIDITEEVSAILANPAQVDDAS